MITALSDALAERGYTSLTDVQEAVTAPELTNADLLVSAQTGSGKTVGFGLAIAPTLLGDAQMMGAPAAPLALVVAPTRELAMQVQRELAWLYKGTGAWVVSCIGGMDARNERRALERGAHIVVGTPGRLRDHIERGALDLGDIRAIVLDEADEMLDLGFREDLEFMLGAAPEDRRTLMFSATVSPSIAELAKSYQRDAVRVTTLTKGQQHSDIEYQAVQVAMHDVEHAIINLLRFHDAQTAIVFANTRAAVARLTARFSNRGFLVVSLSGELSQDERSHALQALRDGRARVCVATDVAARGIDLPNLELVVHADLPTNTEALLHRSGRTGRAGRKGISALIVPDKATKKAERLLKWAKIEAKWGYAPSPEDIRAKDQERLMSDSAWTDEATPDEATFATGLLGQYSPEQIAVACLRLYQGRLSAPEELNAPNAPKPSDRAPRADFGPSAWIALSVGRDRNAEARWLLPMLCRAGDLEKTQIGKIRVTDTETFIELTEAARPGFLAAIGADGVLEDGIKARPIEGEPDLPPPARRPRAAGGAAHRKGPRADRAERGDDKPAKWDRPSKPAAEAPEMPAVAERVEAPVEAVERPARAERTERPARKEFGDRPKPAAMRTGRVDRMERPKPKPVDAADGEERPARKPRHTGADRARRDADRSSDDRRFSRPREADGVAHKGAKPYGKSGDKPAGKGKPYGKSEGKPYGKSEGKPYGKSEGKGYGKSDGKGYGKSEGKPYGKSEGKPYGKSEGKPYGKSEGKSYGKSEGKPYGKSDSKPYGKGKPADRAPGKFGDKPSFKVKGKGGDTPPRRKG